MFSIVAHGTDGDVQPVLRIAGELVRRGHEVALLSHARYARRTRDVGARFVAVDTLAADETSQADGDADINALGERADLDRVRAYYERHGFFAQFRFELRALRRLHRPGRTVLVGFATTSLSVLTAAELLGAPAVLLAPSPFHLMVLPRIGPEYAAVFGAGLDPVRAEFGLGPVGDWTAWLASASSYVGMWPDWFDAAGVPAPPGTALAGFVPGDDSAAAEADVLDVLDGAVLVTGSSGRLTGPEFYASAVAGIRRAGLPAVVVSREPVEGAVCFPRLPFRTVMPRFAAVIHHGGIGTSVRALSAGTPQLLLPDGVDRPDNAARLAALGLATVLPPDTAPPALAAALTSLLAAPRPVPRDLDSVAAAADTVAQHVSIVEQ